MPTPSPASTPTDEQVFIDKLIGQSPWSARSVTNSGFWRLQRSAGAIPALQSVGLQLLQLGARGDDLDLRLLGEIQQSRGERFRRDIKTDFPIEFIGVGDRQDGAQHPQQQHRPAPVRNPQHK